MYMVTKLPGKKFRLEVKRKYGAERSETLVQEGTKEDLRKAMAEYEQRIGPTVKPER